MAAGGYRVEADLVAMEAAAAEEAGDKGWEAQGVGAQGGKVGVGGGTVADTQVAILVASAAEAGSWAGWLGAVGPVLVVSTAGRVALWVEAAVAAKGQAMAAV